MLNSSGRLRIVSDTGWLPSVATALAIADGYVGYGIQYGQDYYNKLVRSSCRRKCLGFFGRERRRKRIVMLAAGDGVRKARTRLLFPKYQYDTKQTTAAVHSTIK